jgi:hypothetical protein
MRAQRTLAALAVICGAGLATAGCKFQQTSGLRESGQSTLMDKTFAAKNACNPEDHNRPFIIEWDATDMSSFESLAANDIVMVKYEGCKLRVLDECRDDDVKGSFGAYKPTEWTSGSLETIDIHNEGELYAKLPLGRDTLSGRVAAGEEFHMEYFVAGTTYATRSAVYRDDLKHNLGCDPATHFVYAYNLGAFALGSVNEFEANAGGSIFGYGIEGKSSGGRKAEKKGGDLSVCREDEATEVLGCKTPIRLNLRKIRDGVDPDKAALNAPDDAASMAAAAQVDAKVEMSAEARAHYDSAMQKLAARDGKGCLAELDAHDELDPDHKSTDPKVAFSLNRAQCIMLAGQCDAGKDLVRRRADNDAMARQLGPEHTTKWVEATAMMYCQGDSMSDRDRLLQALYQLQIAAYQTRKNAAYCEERWKTIAELLPKVEPRDADDMQIINAESALFGMVPMCFQRAGDCARAFAAWKEVIPERTREHYAQIEDPQRLAETQRRDFENMARKCKDE